MEYAKSSDGRLMGVESIERKFQRYELIAELGFSEMRKKLLEVDIAELQALIMKCDELGIE